MRWLRLECLMVAMVLGCSRESNTAAVIVPHYSSADLAAAFKALPLATRTEAVTQVGQMTMAELYGALQAAVPNQAVVIDGQTFADQQAQLAASRTQILSLSSKFPTVADLWEVLSVDPKALIAGNLAAQAWQGGGAKAGLGLTGPLVFYGWSPQKGHEEDCEKIKNDLATLGASTTQLAAARGAAISHEKPQLVGGHSAQVDPSGNLTYYLPVTFAAATAQGSADSPGRTTNIDDCLEQISTAYKTYSNPFDNPTMFPYPKNNFGDGGASSSVQYPL